MDFLKKKMKELLDDDEKQEKKEKKETKQDEAGISLIFHLAGELSLIATTRFP